MYQSNSISIIGHRHLNVFGIYYAYFSNFTHFIGTFSDF